VGQEDKYFEEPEGEHADFVPAVFARSMEEAEKYRQLLDDHDIPAIIGSAEHGEGEDSPPSQSSRGFSRGVPVLVPDALLDEAGEVIADSEESDEFALDEEYDADDDEEEDDFDLEEDLDGGLNEPPEEDDLDEGDDLFDEEES